ncbi:MAG: preprotein translocase subunit YajC [Firmicutes bacterium]|nr:preprotein translocase subunit YajC [Bacillota bacterium]
MSESLVSFIPLIVLFVAMYFLMIRPQKKKDKQIADMRNSLQVGDEIVTIGGICGKIVKTKDESIIIAVGADKVKFEMKRWAVSTVETHANRNKRVEEPSVEEEEVKKVMPKKLKKSSDIEGDE